MEKRSKSKLIPALLLAAAAASIISLFLFTRLDTIINSDMYNYGLQPGPWQQRYTLTSQLMISFFLLAALLSFTSMASVLIYFRTETRRFRRISYALLFMATLATAPAIILLLRIDAIVNIDLYNYGLQFSSNWIDPYWIYLRSMIALSVAALGGTFLSSALFSFGERKYSRIEPVKLVSRLLLIIGAASLIASFFYTSTILAFIGLGLVFWGAILIYVSPEEHVKKALLDAIASASMTMINQALQSLEYKGETIYLPPKYLKDPTESKIFISKTSAEKLPSPEQILEQNPKTTRKFDGLLLTPTGADLLKLFEKTLGTDFTRVELKHLFANLSRAIVEELEIAGQASIEAQENRVVVQLEDFEFTELLLPRGPNSVSFLPNPVTSAIACALAKVSGKPIIIEDEHMSGDEKRASMTYRILNEEES